MTILLGMSLLPGCSDVGYKGDRLTDGAGAGATWPFGPRSIRLHPFTQIAPLDPGPAVSSEKGEEAAVALAVEARVELLDQLGDVTKGVGSFRFELYDVGPTASRRGEDLRLQLWEAPVLTLEQNKRQYDSITRTYAFRLPLDVAPPARRPLKLSVQFSDQSGLRLMADMRLSYLPR
ncbi:MAG: hypothetical protein ACYTGQ_09290 [Planctomycetota bacterium]